MMDRTGLVLWLDSKEWFDTTAQAVQQTVGRVFDSLGPAGRQVKNVLHGTWLGHPLHPVLTDIPLGAWTATVVLDAVAEQTRSAGIARASDIALELGLVGAVGAAVTGAADWKDTDARPRRLGLAHAVLNVGATLLFGGSLICRATGNRTAGRALAATGYLVAAAAAYLGGELVYQEQVGVNHSAGLELPEHFTAVLADAELAEGRLMRARYKDTPIMLVRQGNRICALIERCAHLGGPLADGKLENDAVTCPWHGSRFDLASGAVIDGPSAFPQPRLEARTRDGQIEVRASRAERSAH
jgi:nitrite reductase/ring-hydroxylating ferredoxin subunit/uncharacterized membrane protein